MDLQGEGRFNRRAVLVGEAQRRVLDAVQPLEAERAPLWRCGGRFLAEPYTATADWPPFARAGLDGYAVRAADVAQATPAQPAALRVIGAVAAGQLAEAPVAPGTAVRIMTGAAVPEGADAVVMLEQTAVAPAASGLVAERAVLVKQPAMPGRNIAPRGEEFRRGDAIAGPGERLRPGHIAQLGTFGYAELRVHRRPRVAVLATGSELLPVEAPLAPGRIRDSNSAMLAALIAGCGAEPLPLGRLADDPGAAEAAIAAALQDADAVVTTGGVSVGDYDVMAVLIRRLRDAQVPADAAAALGRGADAASVGGLDVSAAGTRVLFDKVAMRPGSPTSTAILGGKPLFALSGNPGACRAGFELFVRPALLRMAGSRTPLPRTVQATLREPVAKGSPHERFVNATLEEEAGRLYATPLAFAKSSMMASLPQADALLRIPAGPDGAPAGALVEALLLPDAYA